MADLNISYLKLALSTLVSSDKEDVLTQAKQCLVAIIEQTKYLEGDVEYYRDAYYKAAEEAQARYDRIQQLEAELTQIKAQVASLQYQGKQKEEFTGLNETEKLLIKSGNKIGAIKSVRSRTSMCLRDSKIACDEYEYEYQHA